MMDVESVIFPKLDDDLDGDLSLFGSEDEVDGNNVTDRMEKESNYGSMTSDLNIGRHNQDAPEETGLTKEKKMDILRKLIKEVKLEDTLDKYRGLQENGNHQNKSVSNSQALQTRSRMGSDVLLWADRQYMSNLEDELEKQYQADMDRKEEERADLERQRVRRLMVEGIIGPEDMNEGYSREKDLSATTNGQAHPSRFRKGTATSDKSNTPQPSSRSPRPFQNPGHKSAGHKLGSERRKSTAAIKPPTPRYYTESTFSVDTQVSRQSRNGNGSDDESGSNPSHRCYVHDKEGCACDSQKPTKSRSFTKRYIDPQVIQLEEEESVDGMYSLAEQMLPETRPKPHLEDPEEARIRRQNAAAERKKRELALAGRISRR